MRGKWTAPAVQVLLVVLRGVSAVAVHSETQGPANAAAAGASAIARDPPWVAAQA